MKKIIVEQHHGIGDLIHMLPFLKALRTKFSDAQIDMMLGSKQQKELIENTNLVDQIYFLDLVKMSKRELLAFILKIRRQKYDIGFVAPSTTNWKGRFLLHLVGCKQKVFFGEENKRNSFWNEYIVKKDRTRHVIERNLDLLRSIEDGLEIQYFNILSPDVSSVEALLGYDIGREKTVVCGIGTGDTFIFRDGKKYSENVKKWDMKNWLELINDLSIDHKVILLGGGAEKADFEKHIRDYLINKENVVDLIGKTGMMESAAIIKVSDLLIAGDTGLLHIADSMERNTIGIFGPSSPYLVGPISNHRHNVFLGLDCQFCMDTEVLWNCDKRRCLDGITVEMIRDQAFEILESIRLRRRYEK